MSNENNQEIELEGMFKDALELMEYTNKNLFITGKAGTGKSTLLNYFKTITKKNVVILASTGVAALNINGQTVHSFFKFGPDLTASSIQKLPAAKSQIYKKTDMIIIDEVSMIRADVLDCIDKFMRINGKSKLSPFGGVQMVFVGDLYQLPPVVNSTEKKMFKEYYKTEYFFDAHVFKNFSAEFIELEKNYRQVDDKFIEILNCVRNNTITSTQLQTLNKKFNQSFNPKLSDNYITLVPTNRLADSINNENLAKLDTKLFTYAAKFKGNFDKHAMPGEENLAVKVGAQVMLLNNDKHHRWVNGSIGNVIAINQNQNEADTIIIKLSNGKEIEVDPYSWELFKFSYDPNQKELIPEVVGRFTQYPLMLAWAVTIHKSQGKTFDKVIIDIGSGTFANGQLYVALSRCKTLDGIILKKQIQKKHIFSDWRVIKFLTNYQYKKSNEYITIDEKIHIINKAIKENNKINITYLKPNDEKSKRTVEPSKIGDFVYLSKHYLGMIGFDSKRNEYRNFKIERILDIEIIDEK